MLPTIKPIALIGAPRMGKKNNNILTLRNTFEVRPELTRFVSLGQDCNSAPRQWPGMNVPSDSW